jgi:mannitol/fructose-specific phosphotransferase system IIA component (Ntr-type)
MKLTEILLRDACVVEMKARTKDAALEELARAMAGAAAGLEAGALYDLLSRREEESSTATGDGVAIPHARIESVPRVLAAFGRSRGGIDFKSIDGKLTHLFFLLVAPGREGSAYLLTLARLSRLLSNEEFRGRLLDAESTDAVFQAFVAEETRST